jgi:A/G-specific adenine glycosylase
MKKSAVALIFHKDNKDFPIDLILGVSRKYDHKDFGLPGGSVEDNETFRDAIIREVKEETGLTVTSCKEIFERSGTYKGNEIIGKTFLCEVEGEIHTDEPHAIMWVSWETLFNGSFGEYNKALFDHLNK